MRLGEISLDERRVLAAHLLGYEITSGHNCILEGILAGTGCNVGNARNRAGQDRTRRRDVLSHVSDDHFDGDFRRARVPDIVISHQCNRRVTDLRFAGQLGFGNRGHADDVDAP